MSSKRKIQWYLFSQSLIRSRNKLSSTIQILVIASLLLNFCVQGQIVAVENTPTFTSVLNKSNVNEPLPILSIDSDVGLKNLTRNYLDAYVAGYVSKEIALNILWPFEIASKVWAYVKKVYGSYGPDPHAYVFLCVNATIQGAAFYRSNLSTSLDTEYNFKNVFVLKKEIQNAWTENFNQTTELINFTSCVGRMVEFSSRNRTGSPGYNNYYDNTYRSSAFNFIFVYDVFSKIGMKQEAEFFLADDPSSPLTRNDQDIQDSLEHDDRVNWIKNWFWPIYYKYGGAQALSQFIKNCNYYHPRKLLNRNDPEASLYYKYNRTMNKGEFVHFWSGSVGFDLRHLADFAFTWDLNDENNFQRARNLYSMLNYQCNDTNCKYLPALDQKIKGVPNNFPSNVKNEEPRPSITVISEIEDSAEEPIRKRVKGTWYRPINQSERYLYDGKNELFIFETPFGFCYYITCSAPYIIKWVANIPFENQGCKAGVYLNSRRLQDPTQTNQAFEGQEHKTLNQVYTIQLIVDGVIGGLNMGLLKCESIKNSTESMHIYLTDNNLGLDPYDDNFPPNIYVSELFWNHNSDNKLIVPCIGRRLKMMPDLRMRTEGNSDDDWTKWKTIWDKQNKTVDSESIGYNVTYDSVIGFTLAYEIWPFNGMSNTKEHLYFECFLNNNSRIKYKIYLTSEDKKTTPQITIVDEVFEIASHASGCFLIKNVDQFFFVGNITYYEDYPLKLISCSTVHACDLFRQCLDYAGDYCYADQRKLQADYVQ